MKIFRNIFCVNAFLLLLLLTACAPSTGPVTCRSRLREDKVIEKVRLSDGELLFGEMEYGSVIVMHSVTPPYDMTEEAEYDYERVISYLQCDLIEVLTNAGVSERCVPSEDDFFTSGYRALHDAVIPYSGGTTFEFSEGTYWGGEGFDITVPDEEYGWISRKVWLGANLQGQYIGLPISEKFWDAEPNSRVGEIPVYISAYTMPTPALGGYETNEFYASFDIGGYTYRLLTDDCTQEEFVDVLLAIINHYGAYPSRAAGN